MIRRAPAKPEDAFELQLRKEDQGEVSPGWRQDLALTIFVDGATAFRNERGELLGLYGLSVHENEASPWLLCSPLIAAHKADVWRLAKREVDRLRRFPETGMLLYNYIPKASPRNRAFVRALGFRILPSPRDGFDLFYLPCANPQPSSL